MRQRTDWTPRRWLRILLPAVVILIWFAAGGIGGPTFGKLSSVSSNDQASFLPASAESTEVQAWQKKFTDSKAIPAIVVVESSSALTQAQLGELAQLATALGAVPGVQEPSGTATTSVVGPIPSSDATAAQFIVPVADTENVKTVVANLRSTVNAQLPAGTQAWVTGPAGLTADLVNAFGGIDGILLLVAVGAVLLILLLVYRSIVLPFWCCSPRYSPCLPRFCSCTSSHCGAGSRSAARVKASCRFS